MRHTKVTRAWLSKENKTAEHFDPDVLHSLFLLLLLFLLLCPLVGNLGAHLHLSIHLIPYSTCDM